MEQLFRPGQEVVCIADNWRLVHPYVGLPNKPAPKLNEIYTVLSYYPERVKGKWYLYLKEFDSDQLYCERHFAEVMPTEKLESELSEILDPIYF